MEILDILFKNRKILYLTIAVYFIITIIILINIWLPEKEEALKQYTPYNEFSKMKEMSQYYFNNLSLIRII